MKLLEAPFGDWNLCRQKLEFGKSPGGDRDVGGPQVPSPARRLEVIRALVAGVVRLVTGHRPLVVETGILATTDERFVRVHHERHTGGPTKTSAARAALAQLHHGDSHDGGPVIRYQRN